MPGACTRAPKGVTKRGSTHAEATSSNGTSLLANAPDGCSSLHDLVRVLCDGDEALKAKYWKDRVVQMEFHAKKHEHRIPNTEVKNSLYAFYRQLFVRAFVSGLLELLPSDVRRRYVRKDQWVAVDPAQLRGTLPMTRLPEDGFLEMPASIFQDVERRKSLGHSAPVA